MQPSHHPRPLRPLFLMIVSGAWSLGAVSQQNLWASPVWPAGPMEPRAITCAYSVTTRFRPGRPINLRSSDRSWPEKNDGSPMSDITPGRL